MGPIGGKDGVPVCFDGVHGGPMGGGIAKIVQEVSAGGDACTVDFIFLRPSIYCVAWLGNFFPAGANFLDGVVDKVFPGSKFAECVIPYFSTGKCIAKIIVVGVSSASRKKNGGSGKASTVGNQRATAAGDGSGCIGGSGVGWGG